MSNKNGPKKKRAKREYIVGYIAQGNSVYGREFFLEQLDPAYRSEAMCQPMTLRLAEKALDTLPCSGAVIYRLVPCTKPSVIR